jgi:hypothetical protein
MPAATKNGEKITELSLNMNGILIIINGKERRSR